MPRPNRLLLILSLSLFVSACETLNVQKIGTAQNFVPEQDEARLWKRQEELEQNIKNSGYLYQNQQLTEYVNRILEKLTGNIEKSCNVDLRAYVISDPECNAFCLGNGAIFIHTGILAAMDNEAQLATLLAHEASHFIYRHELKQFRNIKNKSALYSTLQVTFAGAPFSAGTLINLLSGYAVLGSIFGYSRESEKEADKNAFNLIAASEYDPRETKKFLENLYEVTKLENKKIPYFYSTHPKTKTRIRDYDSFINEMQERQGRALSGALNTREFLSVTRLAFLDTITLGIKANKLKPIRFETEKYIKLYPDDFMGYYYLGLIDAQEGKTSEAESHFKKSIAINQNFPGNHKSLGVLYYKQGNKQLAKREFNEYLVLSPEAEDADYIRGYINE